MHNHRFLFILCAIVLLIRPVYLPAYAQEGSAEDETIMPPDAGAGMETETEIETETETEIDLGSIMDTETVYEIPPGISDGLRKDQPLGEAADMTQGECDALMQKICEANAAALLWKRHDDVFADFRLFDEEAQAWKEYSCFYADPDLYYSDDWTPGLEELRLLIRGENDCVEDYMKSQRFLCFLNASGKAYRDPETDPVTLDESTMDEMILALYRTEDSLFVITQLTESSILNLGLEDVEEGSFYSCLYLLDPDTLEARVIEISVHEPADGQALSGDPGQEGESGPSGDPDLADGSESSARVRYDVRSMRYITFTYDHGMPPFVETGCLGLLRHMDPEKVWEEQDLRTVTVTLDPGTDREQEYSLTTLKGDPVSFTLPDGYSLFADEALTTRWLDDGNYVKDLDLWAGAS